MPHHHDSPPLHRMHRRQRTPGVDDPTAATPSASAAVPPAADPSTTTAAPVAAPTTTTPPAAPVPETTTTTTTEAAPVPRTTTTTEAAPVVTTTQQPVPATTTTTRAAAVETTTTTREALATRSTTPAVPVASSSTTPLEQPTLTRTSIVVVSGSSSTILSAATSGALADNNSGGSDGPSTGAVVGIVAGALLGVIALAALIGYAIKKKRPNHDDDEPSPFDKEEFRRTSAMLDDDDVYAIQHGGGQSFGGSHHGGDVMYNGGHSPQMSEYSTHDLGRSNTIGAASLPGLGRNGTLSNPRPPTAILNHYQHQQMMPSYAPGQVMPSYANNFGGPAQGAGGMDMYGGYPMPPSQQAQLERVGGVGPYAPQHVPHQAAVGEWGGSSHGHGSAGAWAPGGRSPSPMAYRNAPPSSGAGLERGPSNASAYSVRSGDHVILAPPGAAMVRNSPPRHLQQDQRLSLVQEEFEALHGGHGGDGGVAHSRSGTPTNSNVQQSYFSRPAHGRDESADFDFEDDERTVDGHRHAGPLGVANANNKNGRRQSTTSTALPGYEPFGSSSLERERERRRLSVRNGGDDEDAYGGI